MKFAFVLKLFQQKNFHGGGEKLFSQLITSLINDGHHIDIYCANSDTSNYVGISNIIEVSETYNHNKPESMERFYSKVKELLEGKKYDYIISENITPPVGITFLQGHSLVNRLKKLKNPIESFLYNFRKVKKDRIKYQQKWMNEGYKSIFVPSNILKQDIIDNFGIDEDKIKVVYPGVDVKEPFAHSFQGDEVIFGLTAPGFNIKGGYVFVEALKRLKRLGLPFKAKIIYPKHAKNLWLKFLLKLYRIENNIEFLGFQSDMSVFYNSIDCLVVPSLEDTFGLAALEAMAYSKPCIVSSNAGASEIISHGENGYVFQFGKNSVENLVEQMIFVIGSKNKLETVAENAYDTANRYSWGLFYKEFIAALSN